MAIHTRFGSEVKLLTAQLVPVWIEKLPGEIKWHYSEPKPGKKRGKVREEPIWHVTAKYAEGGELVCDGKLFNAFTLLADEGSKEIQQAVWNLNPAHMKAMETWNVTEDKTASFFFNPVTLSEVA